MKRQKLLGKSRQFESFYRAEFPKVFRSCFLFSGNQDQALDASQEAFVRAYARWWRLADKHWAGGWVTTTALNLCRKDLSARERITRHNGIPDKPISDPCPDDALALASALSRLPTRRRTALILHYLCDQPIPLVAQLMGISEGSVKAHLAQGRSHLRTSLEVKA